MPDSLEKAAQWPADEVRRRPIDELVPYARNARTHSPEQISQLAASMIEWGWTNPVLVDERGGIIAGHGRIMAAQKLRDAGREGYDTIPTMTARGWTDAQKRAYILADNKLALNAGWDDELLRVELADLMEMGAALDLTGFSTEEVDALLADAEAGQDETYSRKIEAPIYQPTGENPPVASLVDDTKARDLKAAIRAADLPEDVAAFLEVAADRHTIFNFARIAEFYAHAEPEVQALMEASALVIIDFDQAIANGFVRLSTRFGELAGTGEDDDAA